MFRRNIGSDATGRLPVLALRRAADLYHELARDDEDGGRRGHPFGRSSIRNWAVSKTELCQNKTKLQTKKKHICGNFNYILLFFRTWENSTLWNLRENVPSFEVCQRNFLSFNSNSFSDSKWKYKLCTKKQLKLLFQR